MTAPEPKTLPLPSLEQTVAALVSAARAVAPADVVDTTRTAGSVFLQHSGPEIQAELEKFAATEREAGRSWFSAEWLRGYLSTRTSLLHSTNVSFQINPGFLSSTPEVGRAAEFIYRAATIHLDQARGTTPQETDARGNPTTMDQWQCFDGGIRHPQSDLDTIHRAELGDRDREIGVFWAGRLFAVPMTDQDGSLRDVDSLAASINAIIRPGNDKPESREQTPADLDFAVPSAVGSETLAPILERALEQPHNQHTYRRLTNFLFTITLTDEVRDGADHLHRSAFEPGHSWACKPISYEMSLADSWLSLNVEHSTVDGATLVTGIRRMHDVTIPASTSSETPPPPEEVTWEWPDEDVPVLKEAASDVSQDFADIATRIVTVPHPPADQLPFRISADAAQQLILTIAQLLIYGRARGVYEAVDMREYRAGRTECLRAVTPQAVKFASLLLGGEATRQDLDDVLGAHRAWVKACKRGDGVDRHLLGLRFTAAAMEAEGKEVTGTEFLTDPGVAATTYDFLSTTSIGGADYFVRYAFVPSVPEGFGISYTPRPESFEYCVTWHPSRADQPNHFLHALPQASDLLWSFVTSLHE
ncbi:choline/carnitine O-acyltransferase [Corynebacterium sp. MC-10]|nr:choline/carnitine O-acyltransferase [Corynebacterium parakroppenstedtii]